MDSLSPWRDAQAEAIADEIFVSRSANDPGAEKVGTRRCYTTVAVANALMRHRRGADARRPSARKDIMKIKEPMNLL